MPKYALPGMLDIDYLLARLLRVDRIPTHAFNIAAIKNVRGLPARLGKHNPQYRQVRPKV